MSRKLLAFCLRLVCIEFVYILFSHSPFEQVCKRFPDAETVTFCDIRRREQHQTAHLLLVLCSQTPSVPCLQAATGFPQFAQRARRLHNQAHPPERPPPLWSREHTPSRVALSQALETVVPVCTSAVRLSAWEGYPPLCLWREFVRTEPRLRSPKRFTYGFSSSPFREAQNSSKLLVFCWCFACKLLAFCLHSRALFVPRFGSPVRT